MRLHKAELSLALAAGSLLMVGAAWGQSSVQRAIWPEAPPWASTDLPAAGTVRSEADTAHDIGDRSGGPPSCQPIYTQEPRLIGISTGEPEKDDYGLALIRIECPAPR